MKNNIIILLLLLGINYWGKGQTPLDSLRLVIPLGHTNSIEDYSLNSDGSNMVTVGSDKKVILWDLKNCKEVFNFNGHTDWVTSVDYSSDDLKIVTNKKSLLYLVGTELDYTDGLNGKGFEWKNPQASRVCGCGESFSL